MSKCPVYDEAVKYYNALVDEIMSAVDELRREAKFDPVYLETRHVVIKKPFVPDVVIGMLEDRVSVCDCDEGDNFDEIRFDVDKHTVAVIRLWSFEKKGDEYIEVWLECR